MDLNSAHGFSFVESPAYNPDKRLLLFFTPVVPSTSGNGTAVRAFLEIEVLSRSFNIALCVVTIYDLLPAFSDPSYVSDRCVSVTVIPGRTPPEEMQSLLKCFGQTRWEVIHAFRMSMIPHALRVAEMCSAPSHGFRPYMCLDMDDYESKKALREAALFAWQGDQEKADSIRTWAKICARGELIAIPKFDRVYLSNPGDVCELSARSRSDRLMHLPNAICAPAKGRKMRHTSHSASILFVGTLNYYPNEDAMLFFCRDILPLIRAQLKSDLTLTIVGMSPSDRVRQLAKDHPYIRIEADVLSVDCYYEAADLAIVPLRIGGGTRIKILEAMNFGVPVVSTKMGADGLAVKDGQELLIATSHDDFARSCVCVLEDQALSERLASQARHWIDSHHTVENMASVMHLERALELFWAHNEACQTEEPRDAHQPDITYTSEVVS